MPAKPRSRRALNVVGATAAAAILASPFGWNAIIATVGTVLILGTIVTIPRDLDSGEYDLFGLGVFAAALLSGLVALAIRDEPAIHYSAEDDPCGPAGCGSDR